MMQTVDIDEFLPSMQVYVTSVPEFTALRCIRESARDFCRTSRIWKQSEDITLREASFTISPNIPDAEILEIMNARLDGVPLDPKAPEWLDENWPSWNDSDAETGSAKYITQLDGSSISVVPQQAGALRVRMDLMPNRTALNLPEILLREHYEAIGMGAAARAMIIPNKEFTNPNAAKGFSAEAMSRATAQKWRTARTKMNAPRRMKKSYL